MTWEILSENWDALHHALGAAFPDFGGRTAPQTVTDLTAFLTELAASHDLTVSEAAEMLDDVIFASLSAPHANEVTHKMVASS